MSVWQPSSQGLGIITEEKTGRLQKPEVVNICSETLLAGHYRAMAHVSSEQL